jgi:putative transposase
MSTYKRLYAEGGCYFFTIVTHGRKPLLADEHAVNRLRRAFKHVKAKMPFEIEAITVLPDHVHCLWKLPATGNDFSKRWMLIKRFFSIGMPAASNTRREKAVWQPRFWEHLIRDDEDWRRHMDYIHYNPVKHGYVKQPADWKYSSFHRAVEKGLYAKDWGSGVSQSLLDMDFE